MELAAKILVTGGGGMLGSALLDALHSAGYANVISPRRGELDLLSEPAVASYMKQHHPAYIFHLASLVFGLKGNQDNQLRSLSENTRIYSNLLNACADTPPQKVFFAGTVASYPYPFPSLPLKEDDFFMGLPHEGEFGYAMAKRHAFAYLDLLKKRRGVEFVYALFTNLFGERDTYDIDSGHVIPSLICKAVTAVDQGHPTFEVWGNPAATRDFLYIKDAAEASISAMRSCNGLLNVASGLSLSMHDLAFGISNCMNGNVLPVWDVKAPVGILSRSISVDRLAASGFIAKYSFSDALANSVKWYRENAHISRK